MEKLNIRIDKWLWMVRLFKTRSIATEACNAGKVKLDGDNVKPSRDVRKGEVYEVHIGSLRKTVEVIDTPKSRVGAPLVPQYYTDLTPQEEYDRMKNAQDPGVPSPRPRSPHQARTPPTRLHQGELFR